MDIVISDARDSAIFLVIPVVPDDIKYEGGSNSENFKTVKGELRLTGDKKLRTLTWSSFLPINKRYSFCHPLSIPNGWAYILFLENAIKNKMPIRVMGFSKIKIPIFNMLMSVDEFNYKPDKANDLVYEIKLTEVPADAWKWRDTGKLTKEKLSNFEIEAVKKEALEQWGLL